jgi:VanZ family protein
MTPTSSSAPRRFQHEPAFPPPAILSRWWMWVLLAAILLIPFFLPIAQSLRRHPLIGSLGEQLHIPLLACLTLLIYWKGPLRGRLWLAAAAAAVLGAAIEVVQEMVGRSALFADWLLDLVGIGLVVGLVLWQGHGDRRGKWLLIALLILIPAQLWYLPFATVARYEARLTFPVIADFQGDHFRWMWEATNYSQIDYPEADPDRGRVLRVEGGPPSRWPGASISHFPCDWTAHTSLVFEARAVGLEPDGQVRFGVRIKDRTWATEDFFATGQWQTFTMPVAGREVLQGERVLDLSDVDGLLFFAMKPQAPFALEIDNIRLQ